MKGEFDSEIQKLKGLNSLFLHQLEISNRKIKELQEQNFRFNSELEEQRVTQKILKQENYRLQQSFKEKAILENILLRKVDLLKVQVDELSQFHFKVKLRKLLKNLIEYLFQ